MWAYNRNEHPPFPVLDITLYHPEDSTRTIHIAGKLDTGADISALPATVIEQLGLPVTSKLLVEGYDGNPATVSAYGVVLEIAAVRFSVQEVLAIPAANGLLGRDVLNSFYVYLNGPDLTFDLSLTPF
jgi:hypothetical protein